MAYSMGSSVPLAIGDRPDDEREVAAAARLPLSGVDGAGGGDAAAVVRAVLDDQLLDELVARMRGEGVRLSGPGGFLTEMLKAVLERGLATELTEHLGYDKHDPAGHGSGNSRNGSTGPARSPRRWCPRASGAWAGSPTSSSASTPAG
jgi:Transposase, Mutator family